jgi:hypothetical protein
MEIVIAFVAGGLTHWAWGKWGHKLKKIDG